MLIMTRSDRNDLTRTLKLEGKLLEPWIGELKSACGECPGSPHVVCLDLRDLTFVDAAGVRFLADLIHDGARVTACSEFVATVLHLNGR